MNSGHDGLQKVIRFSLGDSADVMSTLNFIGVTWCNRLQISSVVHPSPHRMKY